MYNKVVIFICAFPLKASVVVLVLERAAILLHKPVRTTHFIHNSC